MSLKIYNTLTGIKEIFTPSDPKKVKMYVCGPTVYGYIHVGNARPMVFFDVVYRYLRHLGYEVVYVRNITDIDDKIIDRAHQEKKSCQEIATFYGVAFEQDMEKLHVLKPTHTPKASEYISGMIEMIQTLMRMGVAYEVQGEVLFSIESFKEYGKLSKKNIEDLRAGARVEISKHKKHPGDFVLWKPSKPGEPAWESPYGKGRPGWHLECSVMSTTLLGETFDLHAAGVDLIFPHHENEIAQTQACYGEPPVRYWMHNAFVLFGKEKMSKSLGNMITVHGFLEQYPAEVLRYLLLSHHYRSELEFSEGTIKDSILALMRIYQCLLDVQEHLEQPISSERPLKKNLQTVIDETERQIEGAMNDDFNTAQALGFLFDAVRAVNGYLQKETALTHAGNVFLKSFLTLIQKLNFLWGLFGEDPASFFRELKLKLLPQVTSLTEAEIKTLIEQRVEARKQKDFKKADDIRDRLQREHIHLKDLAHHTEWFIDLS
ncbi:MAG: cysteine--tRNA ligase [Deltaproteobacteria bacterium]|nr:cysteine--tRNA ligase [Deltaproteobacteria bacterium]